MLGQLWLEANTELQSVLLYMLSVAGKPRHQGLDSCHMQRCMRFAEVNNEISA